MTPPTPEAEARASRSLLILTGLGLLVRAAFLLLEPATQPVADERTWTNWAVEALVTPRVAFSPFRTRMIFYPPLYPYFIAAFYAPFGTLAAVKWAQVAVGALLVPALGRVGARVFSPAVGVALAAVAAFYPELVWFSVHFWSETLFLVFLWWGIERLLAAEADGGRGRAAAAGLLWGLAILTRETVLYFLPLAALWLCLSRRHSGAVARGAVFLVVALLSVAPWTWRNWVVWHAFVPVSTAGGLNLYQGNAIENGKLLTREEVYERYEAVQGRVEQYRWAQREGIRSILERQPAWIFEKLRDEMPNFWEADSQALYHVKRGAYGPPRPLPALLAAVVVLAPFLAALALFVLGVTTLEWDRTRLLLIGFLAYYNLIHVVTHGYARYRLPALPVVLLFACAALVAWRERRLAAPRGRRAVAAGLLALALAVSLAPSVARNLAHPAFGLAEAGAGEEREAPAP